LLALFTWVNYRGGKLGAVVQNSFTMAKLAGILVIIAAALLLGAPVAHTGPPHAAPGLSLSSFGVALIACLLGYDGWVQLTYVAGEIRDPARNVVRALVLGTLVVMGIYLLTNLAYMRVMTVSEIAASAHVGADAAARVLGPAGATAIAIIVLLSLVGTLNGCF